MDYAWGANGLDAIITQVRGGVPEVGTGVSPSFLLLRMRLPEDERVPGGPAPQFSITPILGLGCPTWTSTVS